MSVVFGSITVETRPVAYKGKVMDSVCLVIPIKVADHYGLCGFLGTMEMFVGDIDVARKLQNEMERALAKV
jgi:hypothetical protein